MQSLGPAVNMIANAGSEVLRRILQLLGVNGTIKVGVRGEERDTLCVVLPRFSISFTYHHSSKKRGELLKPSGIKNMQGTVENQLGMAQFLKSSKLRRQASINNSC